MIDDLLGIPYKPFGRTEEGFDCYGLVIEVEKRLGRNLRDLHSELSNGFSGDITDSSFIKIYDEPVFGDILLFKNNLNITVHIGVYLEDNDFIHCDIRGVRIDKLDKYFRKCEVFRYDCKIV